MKHIDLIQENYSRFTENQKRLADFIVRSPQSAFLTTTDLAKEAKVSQSTVVRFAQALGYAGYPDLQKDLQIHFLGELNASDRLRTFRDKSIDDVARYVLETDIRHIEALRRVIDGQRFEETLDAIISAKGVYVTGMRGSYAAARLLQIMLGYIKRPTVLLSGAGGTMVDEVDALDATDALIALSFPKYSSETIRIINYANSIGCNTVAITDSLVSPAARHARTVLEVPTTASSFFISYTAVSCLINIIVARVAERLGDEAVRSLHNRDELLEKWGHYDK